MHTKSISDGLGENNFCLWFRNIPSLLSQIPKTLNSWYVSLYFGHNNLPLILRTE